MNTPVPTQEGKRMNDLLLVAALVGGWLLLQMVILPKLGVST